ncbi:MAG: hypothetical protein ACI9U2_002678 [Bradymonadia bacterium]
MEMPGTPSLPPPTPPMPETGAPALKQGDTLGGRFVIDEALGSTPTGAAWRAVDEKSGRRIVLLLLDAAMLSDRAITDQLRASVKLATGLANKNIAGVFGMGKQSDRRYVAQEFVDGRSLATLLETKAEAGKRFSIKGAYNLVAHVCNALEAARAVLPHGTLRPSCVHVNRQGRVKVAEFGLAGLRPAIARGVTGLGPWDRPFFHQTEGIVDPAQADQRALGLLVLTLLTGRPAVAEADMSEVLMGLPAGLVDVVRGALDPTHPGAVSSPKAFKQALQAATAESRAASDDDASEGIAPPPPSADDAPSAPPPIRASTSAPGAAPSALDVPDDGTLQRWLVRRDDIDYGPFSHDEVVAQLFDEEIDAESEIYDIETDRRLTLSEFTAFETDLVSWIHEKAKREKVRAEAATKAKAKRRNRMLAIFVGGPLLAIGIGVGGWVWYQSTLPTPTRAYVPQLLSRIEGTLPMVKLPEEAPETLAEKTERKQAASDALAGARATKRAQNEHRKRTREDKLVAAGNELSLGRAKGSGKGFDSNAFNRLIAKRSGKLTKCLEAEARRDPSLRSVTVKMTVIPRGDVIKVGLKDGSARGASCVRSALSGLKVPAFDGTNKKVALPFQVR